MTIRLIPLPSVEDPDLVDPPMPTKAHTLPFPIADVTMDPTQDLIVVSEHRWVAVWTIGSSDPHGQTRRSLHRRIGSTCSV
jgi:hypothetical protein